MKITYDKIVNGERVTTISIPSIPLETDKGKDGKTVCAEFFQTSPGRTPMQRRIGVEQAHFHKMGFNYGVVYFVNPVNNEEVMKLVEGVREFYNKHHINDDWSRLESVTL